MVRHRDRLPMRYPPVCFFGQILLMVSLCVAGAAQLRGADYAGTYRGEDLELKATAAEGGYRGTITRGEQKFEFTGREEAEVLKGTFKAGEASFEFTARRQEDRLLFTTGNTQYTLKRVEEANPLAKAKVANPLAAGAGEAAAASAPSLKNVYRHSNGVTFRYPESWRINTDQAETAGMVVLLPPGADTGPAGKEAYLVLGSASEGVTSADDPRVAQQIELTLGRFAPFLKRTGATRTIKTGQRTGAVNSFEGRNDQGLEVVAKVYTMILDQYAVSLVGIGVKTLVEPRDPELRQVFLSFDFNTSAPAADGAGLPAQLVGVWKNWTYKSVGGSSWEKTTYAVLRADGTYLLTENSESISSFNFKDAGGNPTGNAGVASTGSGGNRGKWSVSGDRLKFVDSAGGVTESRFVIKPNSSGWPILNVYEAGAQKPTEWTKEK